MWLYTHITQAACRAAFAYLPISLLQQNCDRRGFSRRTRTFGVLLSQFQCQPWQQNIPVTSASWQGRGARGVSGPGSRTRHAKGDSRTCARLQELLGEGELDTARRVKDGIYVTDLTGKYTMRWWWRTRGVTSWCKDEEDPRTPRASGLPDRSVLRRGHRGGVSPSLWWAPFLFSFLLEYSCFTTNVLSFCSRWFTF